MLRISEISFPGLGIGSFEVNSSINPNSSFEIAWYAIIITFGMICAVLYTIFRAKNIGIKSDDILDYALALIPMGIVGARLYYVLAELDRYHTFKDVINIRNGGLAIYGGIIGGFIAAVVVSKIKKIPFSFAS